jgi:Zn-dependent protease
MNWERTALEVLVFLMLTAPHEFAHAWMANRLGDDTPRLEGRLTLNPLAHIDWIGTVALPAITSLMGGGFLGWGRAVNVNPMAFRGSWRNGLLAVALAGPASNVVFAVLLAALTALLPSLAELTAYACYLSIYLALFNLLPVPPLDGSKFLIAARIPDRVYEEVSRFGFLALIVLFSTTPLAGVLSGLSQSTVVLLIGLFR